MARVDNHIINYHRGSHGEDIPTCQELMQQPFSPFADGSFLTRTTNPVIWKMRQDGSREITLPSICRLKRYTSHEAGQCLKGKNLLFVGDSLTRYSYFSLAYFIEHKEWPPRFQAKRPCHHVDEYGNETCSKQNEPNVCAEGDWNSIGGWPAFIMNLGGGTDGGMFHGRMESQSVRADPSVETNEYISSEEDGRTKLSYVAELGWEGTEAFLGWELTGCAHNATCRFTSEQYEHIEKRHKASDFDWNYSSITDAFGPGGTLFHEQHPDLNYIFYNRGLWGKIPVDKSKKMMESLHNMTGGHGEEQGRCFYKSTTGCGRSRDDKIASWEYGDIRKASYAAGCEYLDVAHLTEEFSTLLFEHPAPKRNLQFEYHGVFWDAVHYQPWVYEEINNVMLNVLCNTKM